MAFGQCFVCVTDYYALKFILSYNGKNPAILCLQMRFMCWDMAVKHQNDHCLADADYFLHVGADLCYNPLLQNYIQQVAALQHHSSVPTEVPIAPKHQPFFCGPRVHVPCKPVPLLPTTQPSPNHGSVTVTCSLQHLSTWPVSFGQVGLGDCCDLGSSQCLYNSKLTRTANMLAHFN